MNRIKAASPVNVAADMCRNRITDAIGANYHMFMNSVRGIVEIIQKASLRPEDCRIICANRKENKTKLPAGFEIASTTEPVKTFNFYTSTCFEGCDIMDKNGKIFIICDPWMKNTLLDISTSMLQIAGRLRDSRFREEITLIYNINRYEEAGDLESYKKKVRAELDEALNNQKALNQCSQNLRKQIINNLKDYDAPFIRAEEDQIIVDINMVNLDLVSYKIIHGLYKTQVMLDTELQKNNIKVVGDKFDGRKFVELMSCKKMSFKDCCEKYSSIKSEPIVFSFEEDERLVRLRNLCPDACEAVDKLGIEEIRKEKYHKTNILRKMARKCDDSQRKRIKQELDRRLRKFHRYTSSEVKKILGEVYADVNLGKAPTVKDVLDYYRFSKPKVDGKEYIVIEGDRMMVM